MDHAPRAVANIQTSVTCLRITIGKNNYDSIFISKVPVGESWKKWFKSTHGFSETQYRHKLCPAHFFHNSG